jgi:hypothetical protein
MGKNSASYKFEKRKKEIARQKKQEEKRQKKQGKQEDEPIISPDGIPITPVEDIDADLHIDDSDDSVV